MADFFNKVVVGINKGVNSVSENSKVFVEKAKLSLSVKEMTDKKQQMLEQLGKIAFEMQSEGKISVYEFAELCAEIEKCDKEIESLNVQIAALQNTASNQSMAGNQDKKQCTCGFFNKKDALFCTNCGKKFAEEAAVLPGDIDLANNQAANSGKQCICGFVNKADAVFCVKCGNPLAQKEE